MKVTINLKPLALAIASGIVATMTINQTIDKYIHFAGEANALGFFLMASLLCIGSLIVAVEKAK